MIREFYPLYRHTTTPAASYSANNFKVFQSCRKSLWRKDLRLPPGAGQALSPCPIRVCGLAVCTTIQSRRVLAANPPTAWTDVLLCIQSGLSFLLTEPHPVGVVLASLQLVTLNIPIHLNTSKRKDL